MQYNAETYNELSAGLRVDRDKLDYENLNNAQDFFHASEGFVLTVSRRDKKKFELDITKAEVDKDIREQMAADEEKITEAKVGAELHRDQKYQRAYKEYLDACLTADRWEALKNSYRMRADALRNLTQLYAANYFGETAGAADRRESRDRLQRKPRVRDDD